MSPQKMQGGVKTGFSLRGGGGGVQALVSMHREPDIFQ